MFLRLLGTLWYFEVWDLPGRVAKANKGNLWLLKGLMVAQQDTVRIIYLAPKPSTNPRKPSKVEGLTSAPNPKPPQANQARTETFIV